MIALTRNTRSSIFWKYMEPVLKILAVIITLMLVSCEEQIDLPVGRKETVYLVVDGMITTDTMAHKVYLSYTGDFFMDRQTSRASGAQVTITDNMGNIFPLFESSPGLYLTEEDVFGVPGNTYSLAIELEGKTYSASSTMPRKVEIDSLSYRFDPYKKSYRIKLWGQEPEGKGDNYFWHIYKNGQRLTDQMHKVIVLNDDFIDGSYIKGFEVDWWAYDFDFQKGDEATVAQYSICSVAYNFLIGVVSEHGEGQMGLNPSSNIPSNVSNNALGLFYAAAVSYKSVYIE